jgi:hypothetical protein
MILTRIVVGKFRFYHLLIVPLCVCSATNFFVIFSSKTEFGLYSVSVMGALFDIDYCAFLSYVVVQAKKITKASKTKTATKSDLFYRVLALCLRNASTNRIIPLS